MARIPLLGSSINFQRLLVALLYMYTFTLLSSTYPSVTYSLRFTNACPYVLSLLASDTKTSSLFSPSLPRIFIAVSFFFFASSPVERRRGETDRKMLKKKGKQEKSNGKCQKRGRRKVRESYKQVLIT